MQKAPGQFGREPFHQPGIRTSIPDEGDVLRGRAGEHGEDRQRPLKAIEPGEPEYALPLRADGIAYALPAALLPFVVMPGGDEAAAALVQRGFTREALAARILKEV